MRFISTLCFQLCTNCCLLNANLKGGTLTIWQLLNWKNVILRDITAEPFSHFMVSSPSRKGYLVSDIDALHKQIGCVLMQVKQDGAKKPIEFWSRTVSAAEQNYTRRHHEYLAVVWAILFKIPNFEGGKFTIGTDHDALIWFFALSSSTEWLLTRILLLPEFEFEVLHKTVVNTQATNTLLQFETYTVEETLLQDDVPRLWCHSVSRPTSTKTNRTSIRPTSTM